MSSPAAQDKPALERCLALLRPGTSDESKFIGLTLMSELLQSTQDLDTMTRFFDNMDFTFLDRMMQIEDDSVPKDAGVDVTAIRSISVDILSCFSIHWQLLVRKEFKERIPTMLGMLSSSDETDNSKKILKILIRVSAYPQVSMILTNPGYQSTIVDYILNTFIRKDEAHDDAVLVCKRTFLIIQEGFKQNSSIVLNITKDFLPTIMTKISIAFSNLTEKHKPEILQLLVDSIAYLPEAYTKEHSKARSAETKVWTRNLKLGLIQLMSTRQAPATRDDSFRLIGIMLQKLGPEWIFPDTTPLSTTATKNTGAASRNKSSPASLAASMESMSLSDAETHKKFAALVVHLTCVEVRVLMDELADSGSSDTSGPRPFVTEDEAKQTTIRKEQVLPLSYEILEVAIGYLIRVSESEGSLENELFDATGLLKVQESLQGAFVAILDHIKDLQSSSDASPETLASNMIYLASLRILSVWLMEDDSLHAQAAFLLPPLEAVVRYCKSKPSQKSLLKLLEPILGRFHELSLE
ncbi:hypothetical protein BGZ65_000210 [Modicella reniformis]|uniref:Neurochondrin-domain-containing protein n=1 Tax=Modicella reniformis TaxID=1440133 RepID=A0A9P6SUU6_9FUNG|nr:hypothetical protein BGZ65_000210 [Modicella reniformis]